MRETWLSENQRLVSQVRSDGKDKHVRSNTLNDKNCRRYIFTSSVKLWALFSAFWIYAFTPPGGVTDNIADTSPINPLRTLILTSITLSKRFPFFHLQDNFGFDLQAVEAATKKHEAIETDIAAYEERVLAVVAVAKELETENYHDIKRITARKDNVLRLWEYLLELLKARRQRLEMNLGLQRVFQEMLYIMDWMDEMKVRRMSNRETYDKNKQDFWYDNVEFL